MNLVPGWKVFYVADTELGVVWPSDG